MLQVPDLGSLLMIHILEADLRVDAGKDPVDDSIED